jgi:exonuclease SbcD
VKGASPVHSALHSDSAHWIQEYRALASGFGGAGLWLEKVAIETRQAVALDELLERDDALGGLLRAVHALEIDSAGVEGLAEEVAALRQKLPHELLSGEERYDPTDPQYLTGLMEDIKELLMHRLLTTGDA